MFKEVVRYFEEDFLEDVCDLPCINGSTTSTTTVASEGPSSPTLSTSFECQTTGAHAGEYRLMSAWATDGTLQSITPAVGSYHPANSTVEIEAVILGDDGETYNISEEVDLGACTTTTTTPSTGPTTTTTTTTTPPPEIPCDGGICLTITNNSGEVVSPTGCATGEVHFNCPAGSSIQNFTDLADGASIEICDSFCDGLDDGNIQVFWSWGNGMAPCTEGCGSGFATEINACEAEITIGPRADYGC